MNKFDVPIQICQNNLFYDPDSSPLAWEHYNEVYKFGVYNEFDFNKRHVQNSKAKFLREVISIQGSSVLSGDDKLGRKFKIGGETDFNFNSKKVQLFRKILGGESVYLSILNKCEQSHHTLKNFSLMAVTGAMNNFKGRNRFDRLDCFVSNLNDCFPLNGATGLLKAAKLNKERLSFFINQFEDIYEYCRYVYFIEDRSFVNRLIDEGKWTIVSPCCVNRYMILAQDFWELKKKSLENMYLNMTNHE